MNLLKPFLCWALFCVLFTQVEAKSILGIFPHNGYSHFKVFYPLLRNLSEREHNVTVITYIKTPTGAKRFYEELILEGLDVMNIVPLDEMKARTWKGLFDEYVALHNSGQSTCRRFYESGYVEEVLKRHKQQPYDLIITEYFNTDCQLALSYLMDIPVVAFSSCLVMPWYYDRILMPDTPSFVQSEFMGFRTPLTWRERLMNFVQAKVLSLLYLYNTNYHDNKMIKEYLNIDVDVAKIAKQNTRLLFGNQHYSLMGIRPYTQQFVEIGGIHINEEELKKDLPTDIDSFLRDAQRNVIFICWGSMIKSSSLEKGKLLAILNVVKKLKLKVIWKWEADEWPIKSEDFLFLQWAPQFKIMCHPKITLFWGHGGLLSTTEAVYCGKRMLLTPIYGDQFANAFAVENRKIGRIINFNEIEEETLEDVIKQVLHTNYSTKALEISQIFRDRESKPLATATWWIEHILKYNVTSEILHSYAVDLNWFLYYSLDVVAIIACTLIFFALLIKYLWRLILVGRVQTKGDKIKQN